MRQLVECVPNISEGKDLETIALIRSALTAHNIALLDTYIGQSTNRSVFTFVGEPKEVTAAALDLARAAYKHIDMRHHTGSHPRIGALDVLPFVPFLGVTLEECIELARSCGAAIAANIGIPIYLYAAAATNPRRARLPYIRKGEYESLRARIDNRELQPDFGSLDSCERCGASAVGARFFLLAYNINLASADCEIAQLIAYKLRESGAPAAYATHAGELLRLPHCNAIGWELPEHRCAQISTNLTDFRVTPMHRVFEEAKRLAASFGTRVTGSELVGMVPESALQISGRYYSLQLGIKDPVQAAIVGLGLDQFSAFNPATRILERRLAELRPDLLH